MAIRQLVIDVLAPHEPGILEYAEKLSEMDKVEGVWIRVIEQDDKTKTIEMFIEGEALAFNKIRGVIEDLGGSIHSIDQVSAGTKMIAFAPKIKEEE